MVLIILPCYCLHGNDNEIGLGELSSYVFVIHELFFVQNMSLSGVNSS